MTTTFKSAEHAIRWSEQHNDLAVLVAGDLQTVIDEAEALGYSVYYSDLCDTCDDRDTYETYDVWGTDDPSLEEMCWRLTIKVELQD